MKERSSSIRRRAARWLLRALAAMALVLAAGCTYQSIREADARRFSPPGRLVDLGGRRLHLTCEGEGRPTVLMEAGGTQFSTQYARIQRELAPHVRACAYDRAGMGWSDPSPRPASAGALADDLAALVQAAELPPPYVLVGSSAGGLPLELFARAHPGEVAGLVLLDALAARMLDDLPDDAERLRRDARLARVLNRIGALWVIDPLRRGELPEERRELEIALTYRNTTWQAVVSLLDSAAESAKELRAMAPLRGDLRLLVISRDDQGPLASAGSTEEVAFEERWQAQQVLSAARSSRGRRLVAKGSGHHITEDRPDLVVAELLQLIAEIRAEEASPPY